MIGGAGLQADVRTFLWLAGVGILAYYLFINGVYLVIHLAATHRLRDELQRPDVETTNRSLGSPFLPGVAILVPAFNEEAVIVETVQALLNLNYPATEIVVVNDGSGDRTLDRLHTEFDLQVIDADPPFDIDGEAIRNVFRSARAGNLLVVDQQNRGKSAALNTGLWLTDQPLFCAIDADSLIDPDGLAKVLRPFIDRPAETVAVGGTVQVANGCAIEDGMVERTGLPASLLGRIQVMEYLRAFYSGRLGLAQLGSLVLISGAFGVFRTELIREIGGYNTDSITEDFDLVVRLHRHLLERDRDYRIDFVPEPVVWTQVPTTWVALGRQRRRWYRGLIGTLVAHRDIIGSRRYGRPATLGLPFKLFGEGLGRLMEGLGYVILPIALLFQAVSVRFFLLYLFLTVGVGILLSWISVFSEVWGYRRYDSPFDVLQLMGAAVLENVGYRQWRTLVAWYALWEFLAGDNHWGDMVRSGFGQVDHDPN